MQRCATLLLALSFTLPILTEPAQAAPVALTAGKTAIFSDKSNPKSDKALFRFKKDPGLLSLVNPLCPAASEIRIVTSGGAYAPIVLDCNRWVAKGSTLRYQGTKPTDDAAGVKKVKYGVGTLDVLLKGTNYSPNAVGGPATWIETTFAVDDQEYCGRWITFRKNDADRMIARGPTAACEIVCGDGDIDSPIEECDDGNRESGDGCGSTCLNEVCGDGNWTPPLEECDDGNGIDGDGCDSNCTSTACGNGITSAGEQCDDGNTQADDGCRGDCTLEVCGDAILDSNEDCDDGGTEDGDCCSSICEFETGACSDSDNCTESDVCQNGVCVGNLIQPWINEIDYDSNDGAIIDREEFVEIAGPAGLDLGGYTLYGVEGADGSCQTPGAGLLSGPVLPGYVHWSVTIPPATVLTDDTGTGIGFLVVCNTPSSQFVIDDGNCDVVFPGISSESNFKNGQLLNEPNICPDGMLLLDPVDGFVDAVSYEGIVPNAGPLGAFFHIDPPYNAGADEGWIPMVSLEKRTSTLGKAMDGTEWADSGGCTNQCVFGGLNFGCNWFTGLDPCPPNTATPGAENSLGQRYFCSELFCGDGVVTGDEQCDEGLGNSDNPDASCRTDCTLRRCGDGIIDPSAAPGFPETCESDTDCAGGEICSACECVVGTPLGDLDLTVVPGSAANVPVDDGEGTWLRINQPLPALLPITTGSNGQWTAGPLQFTAGVPDGTGVAPFYLDGEMLMSSPLPALAGGGRVCMHVRPDYDNVGFIDCDGGSNVDAALSVDSNGAGAAGAPSLTVAGGAGDSGAGAAVAYIILTAGSTSDNATPCEDAIYQDPIQVAVTTGIAQSQILNGLVVGNVATSLTGQPFDCTNWVPDVGASVVWPNYNLDVNVPVLGPQDVTQVLRLNDD
jgi:cysteine-rich repeat protein